MREQNENKVSGNMVFVVNEALREEPARYLLWWCAYISKIGGMSYLQGN